MDEDLIEGLDNFAIGNYSACMALCKAHANASPQWEDLTARCLLALDQMEAIRTLPRTSPALAATAFFAVFLKSTVDTQRRSAFEKLIENANSGDITACHYAAIARAISGDYIEALNFAKSSACNMNALRVQFCLAIHRPDLASAIIAESARDDSAGAKFVAAMHALVTGKATEAYMSFSDLIAQFDAESSVALSNGRAIANMQRTHFSEAMEDLENILAVKPGDADSLVNTVCCLSNLGKNFSQPLRQLTEFYPTHDVVKSVANLHEAFATFKPKVVSA